MFQQEDEPIRLNSEQAARELELITARELITRFYNNISINIWSNIRNKHTYADKSGYNMLLMDGAYNRHALDSLYPQIRNEVTGKSITLLIYTTIVLCIKAVYLL